jgi:hypothetical protein
MPITSTVTGKDISVFLNEALSPQAQSRAFAAFAREKLREGEEQNRQKLGQTPSHTTTVDGVKEAPLETVRPNGIIVFEFDLVFDLLGWIAGQLAIHSPIRTGEFLRSHALFADGTEVADPAKPPPAQEYVFLSLDKPGKVRSLERGHSRQAPNGVYEVVAELAQRRFGNQASVRFAYHAPYRPDLRGMTGKARRQAEKDVRVPAIVVVP